MTKIKLYNLHQGVIYMGRFPSNLNFSSAHKLGWRYPAQFKHEHPKLAAVYKDSAIEIKVPPLPDKDPTGEMKRTQMYQELAVALNPR